MRSIQCDETLNAIQSKVMQCNKMPRHENATRYVDYIIYSGKITQLMWSRRPRLRRPPDRTSSYIRNVSKGIVIRKVAVDLFDGARILPAGVLLERGLMQQVRPFTISNKGECLKKPERVKHINRLSEDRTVAGFF